MAMRVATFALSGQMITDALRIQAKTAELQVQESSGVKSETFAGYGADAQHVVNLQVGVTRAQSYIDAATLAGGKVQHRARVAAAERRIVRLQPAMHDALGRRARHRPRSQAPRVTAEDVLSSHPRGVPPLHHTESVPK